MTPAALKQDKFEGALTLGNIDQSLNNTGRIIRLSGEMADLLEDSESIDITSIRERIDRVRQELLSDLETEDMLLKNAFFLSCWNINSRESALLWNNYGMNGGIAIKVDLNTLYEYYQSQSEQFDDNHDLSFCDVQYIDYGLQDRIPQAFTKFSRFMFKRKEFEHEEEFRLILYDTADTREGANPPPVKKLPFPFEELVNEIVISPLLKDWQYNNIKKIVDKYNINVPVSKSTLASQPYRI